MSFTWTDTLTPGITQIKKAHIDELRSKYKAVESAVTFSPSVNVSFTDPTITAGETPIRKVHIDELRVAVNNLESKFSNNCNCTNCCQACQSCQGTTCQSCQGCQTCQSTSCQTCQSQCRECPHSCFIDGTMILMDDYSWKPIEKVAVGAKVIGLTGVNTVFKLYHGPLGPSRYMVTFPDQSLSCSGEHLFWVRTEDREFFGAFDYGQFLLENSPVLSPDLDGYYMNYNEVVHLYTPVEFAHLSGWKKWKPIIDRRYGTDTVVYAVYLTGDHSLIANGYVTGSYAHDDDFDYKNVHWVGLR